MVKTLTSILKLAPPLHHSKAFDERQRRLLFSIRRGERR
jgi:hypothetical protein